MKVFLSHVPLEELWDGLMERICSTPNLQKKSMYFPHLIHFPLFPNIISSVTTEKQDISAVMRHRAELGYSMDVSYHISH